MKVDVILGLQWGDEGKGKIVDVLAPDYDVIARFQGGPNAGHTIEFDGKKFILHTIPSGIFCPEKINVIGNGVIIDPYVFLKEVTTLKTKNVHAEDNLLISKKAHLILPSHRLLDAVFEADKGKAKIGSTLKGIGPTYTDKVARLGIRVGDIVASDFGQKYDSLKQKHFKTIQSLTSDFEQFKIEGMDFGEYEVKWFEALEILKTFRQVDSEHFINKCLAENKSVLAEGAQGSLLDIDFGSYPFVTSSSTICAGVCSGLGIAPSKVGKVFGVFKAYCTRVGSGPFPTELDDENGCKMREIGREFGSTTGRPRRCGWLDLTALKYAVMLNGVTELVMMKADVLNSFQNLQISTDYLYKNEKIDYIPFEDHLVKPVYETVKGWNCDIGKVLKTSDFPQELTDYLQLIETKIGVKITVVSLGPDRQRTIFRK